MYGIRGERRLTEYEVSWLEGYEESRPVRIGNAAHAQFQLDVYGEMADAMFHARAAGLKAAPVGWNLESALTRFVEKEWSEADDGIWEVRGAPGSSRTRRSWPGWRSIAPSAAPSNSIWRLHSTAGAR